MAELREPTRDEITRLAYALYLLRGCGPGGDVEDWVNAEKQLCLQLTLTAPLAPSATVRGATAHHRPVWLE